jgi:hypothetical protein
VCLRNPRSELRDVTHRIGQTRLEQSDPLLFAFLDFCQHRAVLSRQSLDLIVEHLYSLDVVVVCGFTSPEQLAPLQAQFLYCRRGDFPSLKAAH